MFKKLLVIAAVVALGVGFIYWRSHHSAGHVGPEASYPRANLTPGAVDDTMTVDKVCPAKTNKHGKLAEGDKTKARRHVSDSEKKQVAEAYGISWDEHSKYEFDHLIPLQLGGKNVPDNLWPELWDRPGAHEKDLVENWLHHAVCVDHSMTLSQAQNAIVADWYKIYLQIKDKYGDDGNEDKED